MKIGVFDSGLGGLIITHSLTTGLPDYDYLYLGDTARVPYGNRSPETVYNFTLQAVKYLLDQNCGLVIIACNTASAEALRRIQREYLPKHFPGRRVLGVLIPAAEAAVTASKNGHIGVIATEGTIASGAFDREIHKQRPEALISSNPAPLLVPLIENGGQKWAGPILQEYLAPLTGIDTLILGCTHYPYYKELVRQQVGPNVTVISQDEIVPQKLGDYLRRHPELEAKLSGTGANRFEVTDLTSQAQVLASRLYGAEVKLQEIVLPELIAA
jgi:glutamate racemase